jgi:type II secretory pathway predicted ATPase ExeA
MYLELFKLHELPFRLTPDPQFLYLSKHHARAKAYMESTIWFTDGFVVITGEIGSGKTTLIETFLKELEKDVVVAQINQTQVSAIEFLQSVLVQFGFSPFRMKKAELLSTLNEFLVEQYANGRRVLLIVDEAQNLSNKVLEEIRLLSGVETTKEKVLRIILAGQPELNDKLNSPSLIQLAQRIRLRFHLTALSKSDTSAYIQHRLEVAGSQGRQIFHPDTYALVYRYTGGIPRLVNTLCDTAMMAAFAQDRDAVGVDDIKAAIDELQWGAMTLRGCPSLAAGTSSPCQWTIVGSSSPLWKRTRTFCPRRRRSVGPR